MNTSDLEVEIVNTLQLIFKKSKSLSVNSELSNEIRQNLISNKGKKLDNKELKGLLSKKLSWARVYFKMSSDQMLKKIQKDYKIYFNSQLRCAEIVAIACIIEDETENKFTAGIVTGKNINNDEYDDDDDSDYDDNYMDKDTDDLKDVKSDKNRKINDFNRSKFFLECFNEYRQNFGLKKLELNPALLEPAKNLSRQITKYSVDVDILPFIDQANQIPGVKNVQICTSFDSKKDNYAKKMFERMVGKSKDVIESDNDKISIGFWNSSKNKNVSVACFLFT